MIARAPLALAALWLAACTSSSQMLPAFTLIDQSGRTVHGDDLRGRPAVVSFIFTTCVEVCPIVTAHLARAQALARSEGYADRVRFVSITVDPANDTPSRLRRYGESFGADFSTWSFLTGSPDEIGRVMRAVGVTTAPGTRGVAHDAPVLFVDAVGRVIGRQRDLELSPEATVAKIRKLAARRA